jgi:multiple antibiotic resistance protein
MSFGKDLALSFVPLFVAIDAMGNVPIVLGLTEDMTIKQRARVVDFALLTASVVGLAFLFAGKYVLEFLSISVSDFAIAGGIVLLALSVRDLVTGKMMETPVKQEMMAIVPIGTPLTVGPATLATLLLLDQEYSMGVVLFAFGLNMVATWLILFSGNRIAGFLGQGGMRAFSKIASLLLAAIAVRLIVKGLADLFPGLTQ